MTAMPAAIVDSRLRWRCRRGMLELDLILNEFIDKAYVSLDAQNRQRFDALLDYPDQLLFDLLLGSVISSDSRVADLIDFIRKSILPH